MTIHPNDGLLKAMRDALEIYAQLTAHGKLSPQGVSSILSIDTRAATTPGSEPQFETTITRRIPQGSSYYGHLYKPDFCAA